MVQKSQCDKGKGSKREGHEKSLATCIILIYCKIYNHQRKKLRNHNHEDLPKDIGERSSFWLLVTTLLIQSAWARSARSPTTSLRSLLGKQGLVLYLGRGLLRWYLLHGARVARQKLPKKQNTAKTNALPNDQGFLAGNVIGHQNMECGKTRVLPQISCPSKFSPGVGVAVAGAKWH